MRTKAVILAIAAVVLAIAALSLAQKPGAGTTETPSGIVTTTLKTPKGTIKANLPDDMAAGDTISGTVIAEPSGKNDKEKQQNAGELNGYVVELEGQKAPVSGGVIQRVHLAPGISVLSLILRDAKGKQIANVTIPVAPAPTTGPSTFVVRGVGQTGRPIQVHGPFDGDSANTSAKVGDTDAKVLAESPRKMVFESPRDVVGPTKIQITENGATATGPFRNLKIDLTAPKTSLLKGESTELHVEVSGLEGLGQTINIQIENQSPSTVVLVGGNVQSIQIPPGLVQTGGTFPWSTGVTGIGKGGFTITGSLPPGIYFSPTPTSPPSTTQPSPSPTPSQPPDTVATRPSPSPPQGGDGGIPTEMIQLHLGGSGPGTGPVTGPRPTPKPTPTPTPTPSPVATPKPTGPVLKPTPTPTPTPPPSSTPTPTPTPCTCDLVTLVAPEKEFGANEVEITKEGDYTDPATGDIAGATVMVTLRTVDHEIKCTGGTDQECSAKVEWTLSPVITFMAKGSSWTKVNEPAKGVEPGDKTYEEGVSPKTAVEEIELKGSCPNDPKAKVPSYTVSQRFIIKYPEKLVNAIKQAKQNKKQVDVGDITGSITWEVTTSGCKSKFVTGIHHKAEPHGGLTRRLVIKGWKVP